MPILYLNDTYADMLLALGIGAAFGVTPRFGGMNYVFPDSGLEPIAFPIAALKGEATEAPFTFHRFKQAAITAFGGRSLLGKLGERWNQFQPNYVEILSLVMPSPTMTDWRMTRFHDGGYTSGATFRPFAMKGWNSAKADGLDAPTAQREIWLLDALRAIGFLIYAQPKLLPREAATARWLVFVPALPDVAFCDRLLHSTDYISSARTQVAAHLVASELEIPRLQVAKYAELNARARTTFGIFALEPKRWTGQAIDTFRSINGFLNTLPISASAQLSSWLLNILDSGDIGALSRLSCGLAELRMSPRFDGLFVPLMEVATIEEVVRG